MVDDLVKHRGFRCSPPVVLELRLCLFPRVAPEHAGWFGEVRLVVVLELCRITDGDSGQESGRVMRLRSWKGYVDVTATVITRFKIERCVIRRFLLLNCSLLLQFSLQPPSSITAQPEEQSALKISQFYGLKSWEKYQRPTADQLLTKR